MGKKPEPSVTPDELPEKQILVRGENVQVQQASYVVRHKTEEPQPETKHTSRPSLALTEHHQAKAREKGPALPAILFEGDDLIPEPTIEGGGAGCAMVKSPVKNAETGANLNLVARDPQSIYAYWDFDREQRTHYNELSADKHMVLLIWETGAHQRLVSEITVHPDSRHWFVHVPTPGGSYCGELGYYNSKRQWITVATSEHVATPGSQPHPVTSAAAPVFASVTIESNSPASVQEAQSQHSVWPLADKLFAPDEQLSVAGPGSAKQFSESITQAIAERSGVPFAPETYDEVAMDETVIRPFPQSGSDVQTEALSALPRATHEEWGNEEAREILMISGIEGATKLTEGSIEVVDLLQRWVKKGVGISSIEALEFGLEAGQQQPAPVSSPGGPSGVFPGRAPEKPESFWLNVNAELVVYGATEPDAKVTIGGRSIRLRPDGSFSYRFSLPDGRYGLPIRAVSSAGDVRGATLQFSRDTTYQAEVGAHPQDPALAPPQPENIPQ